MGCFVEASQKVLDVLNFEVTVKKQRKVVKIAEETEEGREEEFFRRRRERNEEGRMRCYSISSEGREEWFGEFEPWGGESEALVVI